MPSAQWSNPLWPTFRSHCMLLIIQNTQLFLCLFATQSYLFSHILIFVNFAMIFVLFLTCVSTSACCKRRVHTETAYHFIFDSQQSYPKSRGQVHVHGFPKMLPYFDDNATEDRKDHSRPCDQLWILYTWRTDAFSVHTNWERFYQY